MISYKQIRQEYKAQIAKGDCYCILSSIKIENVKDLSLEHLVPQSRVEYGIAAQPENIYPAIKIINNIKGSLLPCEFEREKIHLFKKALRKNNLKKHEKDLVQEALDKSYSYHINPCLYCILSKTCLLTQDTKTR